MVNQRQRILSALGLVVAAITAGMLTAGRPVGLKVMAGEARVAEGQLELAPGALVLLGRGAQLEVTGSFPEGEVDLIRGDPRGTSQVAHVGESSGLYAHDLTPLGVDLRQLWTGSGTLSFRCDGSDLWLAVDKKVLSHAPAPNGCGTAWLSLRAAKAAKVSAISIDGKALPLERRGFDLLWAIGAGVAAVGAGLLLGLANWEPLLILPAALFGPRIGLAVPLVLWIVLATTALGQVIAQARWRRGLAAALAAGFVVLAVREGIRSPITRAGLIDWSSQKAAQALINRTLVERKADEGLEQLRAYVATLPEKHPRIAVLGSSASGGSTRGRFWPQVLQEELPDAQVIPLTIGGATTWHLRRVLEKLALKPDLCIIYSGHNDTNPAFPGLTIAALMKGEKPASSDWVPPVSLDEAKDNMQSMARECGRFWAMEEYVLGRDAKMAEYVEMLKSAEGVTYVDGASVLRAGNASELMLDDVHPSPRGQELLGRFVASKVKETLAIAPK